MEKKNLKKEKIKDASKIKGILPQGGGAKRPLISSAFKRGTSSINNRSFNHLRDLRLLTCHEENKTEHQQTQILLIYLKSQVWSPLIN